MSSTYVIQAKGQLGPAKADSYGDSNRYAAGLTFINLSGPKQSKDKNLKKIVRSSAMRSYRQTEKQKAVTKREYRIKPHTSNSDHANNCNDELAVQEPVRIATKKMSERESGSSMVRVTEKNRPASPMKRRPDHNKNGTLGRRDMVHQGQLLQTTRISGRGDPFNAYPSRDSPLYNDYCMHHCEPPLFLVSVFLIRTLLTMATLTYLILLQSSASWHVDTFPSNQEMERILLQRFGFHTLWQILFYSWPPSTLLLPILTFAMARSLAQ